MLCGDDNTPFFHKYAHHRKFINSIWKIADDRGNIVEGFESIAGATVHHFESLFKEYDCLHLPEIMEIADNFPYDIFYIENLELMILVTIEEIQAILIVSKNDKSPAPDGLPMEVYRALLMSWAMIYYKSLKFRGSVGRFQLFLTLPLLL